MIATRPFGRTGHQSTRLLFGAAGIGWIDPRRLDGVFDVLAEYNSNTVDISHTELTNAIRLVLWLGDPVNASVDNLSVISVDILHPLKQVDAPGTFFVSNEVNRRVVAPHDCVCLIAEVRGKTQRIAIKSCCSDDIRDM